MTISRLFFLINLFIFSFSIIVKESSQEIKITEAGKNQFSPKVASSLVDSSYVVVWYSDDEFRGGGDSVRARIVQKNGDISQGKEITFNQNSDTQRTPSVAWLETNNLYVIVWASFDGEKRDELFGQMIDTNGTKIGSEFQINEYTKEHQNGPSICTIDSGSKFVVVWKSQEQDGELYGVYGQIFDEDGNKIGSNFQINTYTKKDQRNPSCAEVGLNGNGNFVVVWQSYGQDGDSYGVYGQMYKKIGEKIGEEFLINNITTYVQNNPKIANLKNGNFIVSWQHINPKKEYGAELKGQIYDSLGEKIGTEFKIDSEQEDDSHTNHEVLVLKNDWFVAIWQTVKNKEVYFQVFDNNGNKLEKERKVNLEVNSLHPATAALGNDFIVVHESNGDLYHRLYLITEDPFDPFNPIHIIAKNPILFSILGIIFGVIVVGLLLLIFFIFILFAVRKLIKKRKEKQTKKDLFFTENLKEKSLNEGLLSDHEKREMNTPEKPTVPEARKSKQVELFNRLFLKVFAKEKGKIPAPPVPRVPKPSIVLNPKALFKKLMAKSGEEDEFEIPPPPKQQDEYQLIEKL